MADRPVFVVGGGNSAAQAALHLAKYARQVTLLVRGPNLAAGCSGYLVEQVRSTRNVDVVHRVAVTGGRAVDDSLAEIEICRLDDDTTETVPAAGLFVFIGSTPHTAWLEGTVQRDADGYVLVGHEVDRDALSGPARAPLSLETSVSGVFAIGDARRGSVKRVATAVGDGAAVVQLVHHCLAGVPAPTGTASAGTASTGTAPAGTAG